MISDYLKKNILVTGRGATAIYLVFKNERLENIDVLVPGNICYAAVYPIIFSGNNPIFCDVDSKSGNLSLSIIKENITNNTKAILIPHMYGNTVDDLDEIKRECERRDIILIEDCASSFGGFSNKYGMVGKIGDYVIHSFGYSKIIDLGNGGILTSNKDLDIAKSYLNELPYFAEDIYNKDKEVSRLYRKVRNKIESYERIKEIDFRELLLYKLDDHVLLDKLSDEVICKALEIHKNNYNLYDNLIDISFKRYQYNDGSIPWRFSLILNDKEKNSIINRLLNSNLPVSDWYPNVTQFFLSDKKPLKNVDDMEKAIINLPLDIERSLIEKICYTINEVR